MKKNIFNHLVAASVQDEDGETGSDSKVTNERTQSHAWMYDHQHELLYKLSKKVSLLTGLETFRPTLSDRYEGIEAEAWQVGMYGPGGHYLPHYDAFQPSLLPSDAWQEGVWIGDRFVG